MFVRLTCEQCAYDHAESARNYLIDAERLLRIRGSTKRRISRKCQLMHHYITHMRIIGETTHVLHASENHIAASHMESEMDSVWKLQKAEALSPSWVPPGYDMHLDDFYVVKPNSANAPGDVDFNLTDPTGWTESSYLQLYGISQSWLIFVSQTTRLANFLDKLAEESNREENSEILVSLEKQKDELEEAIYSFVAANVESDESVLNPHQYMVRTLNPALIIFFNRRIRKVNSWILQEHVNTVIQTLRDCEVSLAAHNLEGPGAPWPVFMAGCEAMNDTQRDYFTNWMQSALDKTGFTRFQTMKAVMQEVWQRRDKNIGGDSWTWMSILREKSLYVMLN